MNKRDAIRALEKVCRQHAPGASIEDDSAGDEYRLQACAPDGKRWVENDAHHIVISCYRGNFSWLVLAVGDGCDRIKLGLRDATPAELEDSDGV